MRDLCRRLEMSHNMVQARYGSKERLWFAAVDHGFQILNAELSGSAAAASDDLDLLRQAMTRYVDTVVLNPSLQRLIQQEANRPGLRFDYIFDNYVKPSHQRVERILKRLQRAGRVRAGAVSTVYFFLVTQGLGAIGSLPNLTCQVGDPRVTQSRAARLAVEVIIDGLVTDSGPSRE
jgi:TetR/AcrR family transcriptional regulator